MNGQTPAQAAAQAFVTGCVQRGITASMAAVPPEGQLATVRGLWSDVAQAAVDAATEGSLRACGYTLADVGRFLEAEAAMPDDGRHPDGCACQFCREDEREEHARQDRYDREDEEEFMRDAASLDDLPSPAEEPFAQRRRDALDGQARATRRAIDDDPWAEANAAGAE